jgi:DNA-binding protein HU-beta
MRSLAEIIAFAAAMSRLDQNTLTTDRNNAPLRPPADQNSPRNPKAGAAATTLSQSTRFVLAASVCTYVFGWAVWLTYEINICYQRGNNVAAGEKMTKAQLVARIAIQSRLTKKSAAELLDTVFTNIGDAVKADARFSYPGFGTWLLKQLKARRIRNPQTNELMKVEPSRTIRFRPAKELKQRL